MNTLGNILENLLSIVRPKAENVPCLAIERMIDAGDGQRKQIQVGLISGAKQAIRVGTLGEPVHTLKTFIRKDDQLSYEFDNDVTLLLTKQTDGAVVYTLRTPDTVQNSIMRLPYKTISMSNASEELDAIAELNIVLCTPIPKVPECS